MDQFEIVNDGGVGSGELELAELAEPRRDHESSSSRLLALVKGEEAPRLGRELLPTMERSTMVEGGDGQSKLLPKASRLDWRPRRNWLAPVRFLTSAMAPSSPFPVKSLATWSCRSASSASNVAGDGMGEPDGEPPEDEDEDDCAWLDPGDEGANASAGRWRLYRR